MANSKSLESNRLGNPRASIFSRWFSISLLIVLISWIAWDAIILFGDKIFHEPSEYIKFDLIWTGLSPWVSERGLLITDIIGLILYIAIIILLGIILFGAKRKKRPETRVDKYANAMGYGKSIQGLLEDTCRKKAERLIRHNPEEIVSPGIRLGNLVYDNSKIYSDWEAEMLVVAGPRTGKSVSYVIPTIATAPGPCIATSNKRDIVDATKELRNKNGVTTWIFDPENIANEKPTWYWNPVSFIRNLDDAERIAECWRAAAGLDSKDGNSEFFNGGAAQQLGAYLFAASLEHLSMNEVFKWCQDEKDVTPARILSKHDYDVISRAIVGVIGITPETRSGIFAGLKKMVSFVIDDKLKPWISKVDENDMRPEFDPFEFALSKDTLYLLSQKGAKSTPITAALTAVTARAGYEISQQLGGRLPVPLVGVLDECANICPWPELPEIYSYYGSCGIILCSLFQNISQGHIAFGKEGFKSLFDNANTKIYLGGNTDTEFLQQLTTIIGQRDMMSFSVNNNQSLSMQETVSLRQDKILSEQQLAEWPFGRALILSSQNRATIAKTIPWFEDETLKNRIEESFKNAKLSTEQYFSLDNIKQRKNNANTVIVSSRGGSEENFKNNYISKLQSEYGVDNAK